jgi:diaminopimelate decarboxylase
MIEPGRSLVGNAGLCLTEVLYLKPSEHRISASSTPP